MKTTLRRLSQLSLHADTFKAVSALLRRLRVLPAKHLSPCGPPRHILLVHITDYVGDTAMTMPTIDKLLAAMPDAVVDVVTSASMAPVLSHVSGINHVYGFPTVKSRVPVLRNWLKLFRMAKFIHRQLYDQKYDLAILPRWGSDPELSQFFAAMTSAATLAGHDTADDTALGDMVPSATALLTLVQRGGTGLADAVRQMRVLEICGLCPTLIAEEEEHRASKGLADVADATDLPALLQKFGLTGKRYIVLAPGASKAEKRWPAEYFADAGVELHKQFGLDVVVLGGPADRPLGDTIVNGKGENFHNLAGQTSLVETITLLKRADVALANDSGPAHWAAGLGILTLVLSPSPATCTSEALNSPLRFRPVGPKAYILQPALPAAGCGDTCVAGASHCIRGLTCESVLTRTADLIKSQWEEN